MKRLFLLIALLTFSVEVFAQSQMMLYQLNNRLPQAHQINPAFSPDYKVSIGLPVISSTYVTFNTGNATFNNAFTRTADDSLHFDPQKLASNLKENNRIEVNANALLFFLGLRLNKNYFSLSVNERVDGGITYPKTFVELIGSGNGEAAGRLITFDNLSGLAQAYHEIALGFNRNITEKLSIGARAKILSGVFSVSAENISAGLLTSTDSLYLTMDAFNLNFAGYDLFEANNIGDVFQSVAAFKNTGFALDLGASYRVSDKLQVSLSATDIGSITWQDNTRQLQFSEVKYSFKGINFLDVVDENTEASLDSELDSLKTLFEPDTLDGVSFKTRLAPKVYAGATYDLSDMHSFGVLLYGDVFRGTFNPGFGLSYNLTLGHIWTIGVNASYRNSSFKNIGVGTALTLGQFQLYALTENLMAFTNLQNTSLIDARVGLNLVFGKVRETPRIKKKKKKKEPQIQTIDMGK